MSSDDLRTIYDALEIACKLRLNDFDRAQASPDVVSQQRAIRAARDVKRFNQLLTKLSKNARESARGGDF